MRPEPFLCHAGSGRAMGRFYFPTSMERASVQWEWEWECSLFAVVISAVRFSDDSIQLHMVAY